MYPYINIILPSYSVMALIGGFATLLLLFFRIDKFLVLFNDFLVLMIYCIIGLVLGSKVLFAITMFPTMLNNFTFSQLILLIPQSGFVFYGGLIGVLIAVRYYARKSSYDKKVLYQLIAPGIPLFHFFGRLGCFLAGCCYGKTLSNPFVVFNYFQFNKIPTQIIEAIFEMLLFIILIALEKKNQETNVLHIYLVSYAVFRFIIEFFRGDSIRGSVLWFSTSQWISLLILVCLAYGKIKISLLKNVKPDKVD